MKTLLAKKVTGRQAGVFEDPVTGIEHTVWCSCLETGMRVANAQQLLRSISSQFPVAFSPTKLRFRIR